MIRHPSATDREISVNNCQMALQHSNAPAPILRPNRIRQGNAVRQVRGCRFAATLMLSTALLAGCFQTPAPEGSPTLREAQRIEASASPQRAQVAPAPVLADLARALRLYTLIDDTPGMIRVHLNISLLHEQHKQLALARQHAHQALKLAQESGDAAYLYRALLTLGRLENDPELFTRALNFAGTALQRAVALTYLEKPIEAAGLVRGLSAPSDEQAGDLAFVRFAYAQHMLDPATAEQVLMLYKREDNYVGIARSLRLLSDIAANQGNNTLADIYAARADRVESALKGAAGRGGR